MENKQNQTLADMIIKFYDSKKDNIIIINPEKGEYTFRKFDNKSNGEKFPVTLTEKEIECAIMFGSKITIDEICQALEISKDDFDYIFANLSYKLKDGEQISKNYASNIVINNFPLKIRIEILNKYNLFELSLVRAALKTNKNAEFNYGNYRSMIKFENITSTYDNEPREVYLSDFYIEILALLASGTNIKDIINLMPETQSQMYKILKDRPFTGKLARHFGVHNKWIATDIALQNNIINDKIIKNVLEKYNITNNNPKKFKNSLQREIHKS